jgi:putative MATE family efflux protein
MPNEPANNLQVHVTYRQILKIALPISVSILIPQVNFITNNIFVGGLNERALAVSGIAGVFYLIFAVMGFGLNNGLQSLIARRAGENRIDEIGILFHQGIIIALSFAVADIAIVYLIAPFIFNATLTNPIDAQMAISFLHLRIFGLPFLYMFQMRNSLLVGINQTKLLVYGTLVETLANIFFDYSFIYGHFGFPQMGFNGAAIASVIAEALAFFTVFFVMRLKGISEQFNITAQIKYNASGAKLVLVQSSPLILQFLISVSSWEFFYILIEHHGVQDLAISNTMRNIFGLFGCVTWAFASTASMMVSNIIGQNLHHRVMELIFKIMKLSLGFATIIFLLLNIAPSIYLKIYGQGDDFINAAIPVVRVVSAALLIMSVSVVSISSVTGTGNTRINLIIEIIALLFYCAYAYIVLQKLFLSIAWGWGAEWVYWSTMLICSSVYLKSGKWKMKKI